jgi:hypothetical protein
VVPVKSSSVHGRFHFIFRRRVVLVGLAVSLVLAALVWWNIWFQPKDARVERIRQNGYPATLAEWDAWYRAVPADENRAMKFLQVLNLPLFKDSVNSGGRTSDPLGVLPARGKHLSTADEQALAGLLASNQPALHLLHEVSDATPSRYPVDLKQGFSVELPHLPKLRRAVLLLGAEALWCAEKGKSEEAAQALIAACHASDSLSEEPVLISQLARMSGWGIVISRLERVINLTTLSEEQLALLQKTVAQGENPQTLIRGLAGEQANGVAFFTDNGQQLSLEQTLNPGQPKRGDRFAITIAISALKTSGLFRRDKAFFMDVMARNLGAANLPFPERVTLGRQTAAAIPDKFCLFSRMLLPALSKVFVRDADHAARVRTAQLALAVERFRLAHASALPGTLEDLVPTYLNCVPADPYDGKPLRFRKLEVGFVVYSIGSDGRDDGGLEGNPKTAAGAPDITFIVER